MRSLVIKLTEGVTQPEKVGQAFTVCTQCATRRGIEADSLVAGARLAGASAFLEEALVDNAQALVY